MCCCCLLFVVCVSSLFLTAELSDKLPAGMLRMSNVVIFEPPLGIKASLRRSFASFSPERVNRAPAERGRLYFLLAWLHAVVLERLRYTPVSWVKPFEFSETDQQCAMDAIDEWVDRTAQGRANLAPSQMPWDALRSTLEQVIYGGRIDNAFDQSRLRAIVHATFTPQSYESNFPLASHYDAATGAFQPLLTVPEAANYDGFRQWVEAMDDSSNPELIGLQPTAQVMLLMQQSQHVADGLLALQDTVKEAVADIGAGGAEGATRSRRRSSVSSTAPPAIQRSASVVAGDASSRPAWMNVMDATISVWLSRLPTAQALADKNVGAKAARAAQVSGVPTALSKEVEGYQHNPMYRCLQREFTILATMLDTVLADLTALRDVLAGVQKPDNHIRALLATLRRDALPKPWWRAGMPLGLAPAAWMDDFTRRLAQIGKLAGLSPSQYGSQTPIWLGGLQAPDGLVAATRQAVAHAHSWPLEQLELRVTVGDSAPPSADSFAFEGLVLYGAKWDQSSKSLSLGGDEKLSVVLPQVRFTWLRRDASGSDSGAGASASQAQGVRVPVYLDATRQSFLFEVRLPQPQSLQHNSAVWTQRGTCLTGQSHSNSSSHTHAHAQRTPPSRGLCVPSVVAAARSSLICCVCTCRCVRCLVVVSVVERRQCGGVRIRRCAPGQPHPSALVLSAAIRSRSSCLYNTTRIYL